MKFFSNEMVLADCVSGRKIRIDQTPFTLGTGEACDWRLDDPSVAIEHCIIQRKGRDYFLLPANGTGTLLLDGMETAGGLIAPDQDHTLVIGEHLLAFRCASDGQRWLKEIDHTQWFIFEPSTQTKLGPCDFRELGGHLARRPNQGEGAIVLCRGLTTIGFYADQVITHDPGVAVPGDGTNGEHAAVEPMVIDVEYGEFTCPVCWLRFDRGDAMNVAVHASLRGDPILGETQMQRFHATRFNDKGQAVDALNIPAPDLACPHCRRKLPPGFLDVPHHIFSIVGAPSSGKSYYLSVLVKTLQTTLFQQFGAVFRDADPSENVILNQMKTQLFSAATPEEAFLAKTELEGAMYETLPRLGRMVPLSEPCIFLNFFLSLGLRLPTTAT
jgi:hypothetical protein